MDITVAICTWNRAAILDRTLSSFQRLVVPSDLEWEILLVDNNCTDQTQEVLKKHADQLPLRCQIEQQAGLSHARNCAIDAARGDLIIWADDDVCVSGQWMESYADAASVHPTAAFFGGPVDPSFDEDPPHWLRAAMPHVDVVYGKLDWGPVEKSIGTDSLPIRGNFAVRNEIQQRYRFDVELGRNQHSLMSGEETSVMIRMLDDGHTGMWLPEARLEHCIPSERMALDYLRSRFRASGRTALIMNLGKKRTRNSLRGKIVWCDSLCRLFQYLDRPDIWVRYMLRACYLRGQLHP